MWLQLYQHPGPAWKIDASSFRRIGNGTNRK